MGQPTTNRPSPSIGVPPASAGEPSIGPPAVQHHLHATHVSEPRSCTRVLLVRLAHPETTAARCTPCGGDAPPLPRKCVCAGPKAAHPQWPAGLKRPKMCGPRMPQCLDTGAAAGGGGGGRSESRSAVLGACSVVRGRRADQPPLTCGAMPPAPAKEWQWHVCTGGNQHKARVHRRQSAQGTCAQAAISTRHVCTGGNQHKARVHRRQSAQKRRKKMGECRPCFRVIGK